MPCTNTMAEMVLCCMQGFSCLHMQGGTRNTFGIDVVSGGELILR